MCVVLDLLTKEALLMRGMVVLGVAVAMVLMLPGNGYSKDKGNADRPKVFRLSPEALEETRVRIEAGDESLMPALTKLRNQADEALTVKPFSVMEKTRTPPSGDKHDYMPEEDIDSRDRLTNPRRIDRKPTRDGR
jgi:hypothetical protein